MSERLRESLSAMLDDEANELEIQRVIKALDQDPELRETWRRYQAIRTAVTDHGVSHLQLDISSRVREALDSQESPAVASLGQRLRKPFASFAVAASVAATVVIGGQQLATLDAEDPYGVETASSGGVSPVGLINSVGAVPVRASFGTQPVPVTQASARNAYEELARQRMQLYLQEHAEHAALNSPDGLIPFARVPEIQE
ncbi:anti-anti-sigma factor [Mangrovimicrobium sediminis]|uniref:Anti-anti-sigma factor n=1 Tax=Mangrovimicrobium sediminis TaxID=2562682 RepID=A0A4Z0M5K8_9GAMM|nr:sigma-E factor negative regulatory protein [Haliea sp. SAOS-164]TGD74658.1 anti-anti-sigma factor [Haliea sp. SAOS-164]